MLTDIERMGNHAIKRAKERYNLELTFDDLKNILNLIENGKAKKIERKNMFEYQDEENAHYRLRYNGTLIEPVVNGVNSNPAIITFYPTGKRGDRKVKDWLKRFQDPNFRHLMRKYGKDTY
jgi:hypothetical protein